MKSKNLVQTGLFRLVFAGLSSAIICISTAIFVVPLPTGGYANLGDCFVILSGYMLGPVYGALASGIGSGLSDLFLGYGIYAPFTFIIKAVMAVIVYFITKIAYKRSMSWQISATVVASVIAEIVMIAGYFTLETFLYGFEGALPNVFGNSMQGIFGCISSSFFYIFMSKSKLFDKAENILNIKAKHV